MSAPAVAWYVLEDHERQGLGYKVSVEPENAKSFITFGKFLRTNTLLVKFSSVNFFFIFE